MFFCMFFFFFNLIKPCKKMDSPKITRFSKGVLLGKYGRGRINILDVKLTKHHQTSLLSVQYRNITKPPVNELTQGKNLTYESEPF